MVQTLDVHSKENVKLILIKIDPIIYLSFHMKNRRIEMSGFYLNYLLRTKNYKFRKLFEITHKRLETTIYENPAFLFAGFRLRQLPYNYSTFDLSSFLKR